MRKVDSVDETMGFSENFPLPDLAKGKMWLERLDYVGRKGGK